MEERKCSKEVEKESGARKCNKKVEWESGRKIRLERKLKEERKWSGKLAKNTY